MSRVQEFRIPIRLGLIGCGGIVQLSHLPCHLFMPDLVQVSAIADPVAANTEHVGKKANVPRELRYADHREMLENAEVDAVVIATPHHMHFDHAMQAVEAGVAVISEKPMAMTLEDADAIIEAAKRNQTTYTVIHNFLHSPPMQQALAILRSGEIGEPAFGRAQSLFSKTGDKLDATVWRNQKQAGGGCINDTCYHEIYLVEALVGSPVRYVEARAQTKFFDAEVDDLALLMLEHENGAVSTVSTSWGVRSYEDACWCEVHSNQGALRVTARQRSLHLLRHEVGKWQEIEIPELADLSPGERGAIGHRCYFAATFEALANGSELPVSGQQGRHILAIIEAARKATVERRAIEVV